MSLLRRVAMLTASVFVVGGGVVAGPAAHARPAPSTDAPAVSADLLACLADNSSARVRKGHEGVVEPSLYAKKDAKKYGVIKDRPQLPAGSVKISTVFHLISDHDLTTAEKSRWTTMINDQVKVLNDSYAGRTAPDAANTPFRFRLQSINWVNRAEWYHVTPGKTELAMKQELRVGDSETLNIYAADIGGGLLGWAYFPKGYNNGRDVWDGVVILDESMPGGNTGIYSGGDTLTHEVGHWLMLEHTFAGACSASGDGVADTPREAAPQFECVERDSCATPGTDPIHNFMDYTEDECMDHFTQGQSARMSDGWLAFRAGGAG